VGASTLPRWVKLLDLSLLAGVVAIPWVAGNWSPTQLVGAFGLYTLCVGASAQFHRPTTPGTRRVFAVLFVLVCLGALLSDGGARADAIYIMIACVGGWTVGLGFAASFDRNDSAPVERSFSGQITRRG
jgi:hypothetical protein